MGMETNEMNNFFKIRDRYGRTIHELSGGRGVVVRLPKVAIENGKLPYLINAWGQGPDGLGLVSYANTLKEAKTRLIATAGPRRY